MPGSFTTLTISATIAEGGRFDDGFDLHPIRHFVRVRNMFPQPLNCGTMDINRSTERWLSG